MDEPAVCPEDAELLPEVSDEGASAEVKSHLTACIECQGRLRRLRAEVRELRAVNSMMQLAATQDWAHPEPELQEEELPASINKYRVIGQLGRGGQAVVYRVVDPLLERDLVLKLARRAWSGASSQRQRWIDEGRALCRLDHPSIARAIELGFLGDRPFLVMEYIRGRSLRHRLAGGRLGPKEAAGLVAEVARGVALAHALGIVHQDIKPENIVLEAATGRARIVDFGLARLSPLGGEGAESPAPLGGTPAYMAPEQALGHAERIGPATDIFALGALLYEMLVGKAPFWHADPQEALRRAQRCDFDRSALRQAGASPRLAAVCLKAMAPEPAERFASAEEFAAALEQAVRPPRWPWVLLAGLGAAVVGWALIAAWPLPPKLPPAQTQYLLHLYRQSAPPVWVNQALPVRSGWPFRVECDIPAGMQAAIFWYDPQGQVSQLDVVRRVALPDGRYERLISPELEFDGQVGMETVLVCAGGRHPPNQAEVETIVQEVLGRPPRLELPPWAMVVITPDRVEVVPGAEKPRGPIARSAPSTMSLLEDRFEVLRAKLREKCAFVAGVAIPHEP